jgi:hypothetical protein
VTATSLVKSAHDRWLRPVGPPAGWAPAGYGS